MIPLLSERDGAALVTLGRAAIEERLEGNGALPAARVSTAPSAALLAPRGVFVTLRAPDAAGRLVLRGCIGSIEATDPASEAVVAAALQAAFEDPRFPPLDSAEYPAIALWVSVLTPVEPVASPGDIVPGEHGVVLDSPRGRAVFLPEVATEYGWTREELLSQLCRKAGLPDGAWRTAGLSVFRGQQFGGW